MLKADVDRYGGPAQYPKRVLIVGALNELPLGARDERDALRPHELQACLLYTSPSPRDGLLSRMPSSA